jgi:effector-binding domain-containing protein
VTTRATPIAVVAQDVPWDEFPQRWGSMLDEVYAAIDAAGVRRTQRWQNVMLYRDGSPNVEVGVLAPEGLSLRDPVVESSLPAGEAAMLVHRGPYERLGDAHDAVRAWCEANGCERTAVVWEIYGHHEEGVVPETTVYHALRG